MTFKKNGTHLWKCNFEGGEGGERVSNEWPRLEEGTREQNQWVLFITLVETPSPLATTHQVWHWSKLSYARIWNLQESKESTGVGIT